MATLEFIVIVVLLLLILHAVREPQRRKREEQRVEAARAAQATQEANDRFERERQREEAERLAYARKHAAVYVRAACAANAVYAANKAICKTAWELGRKREAAARAAHDAAKAAGATEEQTSERQETAMALAVGFGTFSPEYYAAYAPFRAVCDAADAAALAEVQSAGLRKADTWEHNGVDVNGAAGWGSCGDVAETVKAAAHDASCCHFGGGSGSYEQEALEAARAAAAGVSMWDGRAELAGSA
jgi:hypothetical protein